MIRYQGWGILTDLTEQDSSQDSLREGGSEEPDSGVAFCRVASLHMPISGLLALSQALLSPETQTGNHTPLPPPELPVAMTTSSQRGLLPLLGPGLEAAAGGRSPHPHKVLEEPRRRDLPVQVFRRPPSPAPIPSLLELSLFFSLTSFRHCCGFRRHSFLCLESSMILAPPDSHSSGRQSSLPVYLSLHVCLLQER